MGNSSVLKFILCALCYSNIIQCIPTRYGKVNENILLTCNTPDGFTYFIWKKHRDMIANNVKTINKDPWINRLRIIKGMGQYNLQILNLTKEDTGVYWCELQDGTSVIKQKVHLTVIDTTYDKKPDTELEMSSSEYQSDATNNRKPESKLEISSSVFLTGEFVTQDYTPDSPSSAKTIEKDRREFFYLTAATVSVIIIICLVLGWKVWKYKIKESMILAPGINMSMTNNSEINNRNGSRTRVNSIHSYYEIDEANLQNIRTSIQHRQDERINTANTRSDATASYLEVVPGGSSDCSSSSLSRSQSETVINSYQSISLPLTTNITNFKTHYQSLTNVEDRDFSSWCSKSCKVKKEKGDKNVTLNGVSNCTEGSVRRHSFP